MVRPVTDGDIGVDVLREPAEDSAEAIDIVAIHGIGVHPDDTWCKNVGTTADPQWVNWLDEGSMLPALAPNARIMRYGYQSDWFGKDAMRQNMSEVAKRLLRALQRERKECVNRPLIFIAHCFGGLVVLKALLDAQHDGDEWPGITVSTTGLVFLGTPFRGAGGMSQAEMLEAARREYHDDQIQPGILNILQPGNEILGEVVDRFAKSRWKENKAKVACFYELTASNVGRIVGDEDRTRFVVDQSSGCLDRSDPFIIHRSISRNHFNMNKFGKPSEEDFRIMADVVEDMVKSAHELVLARSLEKQSIDDAPWIVPFERNPCFTGRETQLAKLKEMLSTTRGQTTKIAVIGLGGVGKTQLVLELIYQIREKHKTRSIIWMLASSTEILQQAYVEVAQKLSLPGLQKDGADARKLVQDHLSKPGAGEWIVVFDNADDINMWTTKPASEPESRRLIDYLPKNDQGCVIFTSRDRKTAVKLAHQNVIELPQMNETGAQELLQKRLICLNLAEHQRDTDALLIQLTYLPLALVQAAAYINENAITPADYLSLLAEQEEEVIDLLSEEFEDDGRYSNIKNPVATTWLISFERIRRRDPLAADYLSFMACIDPKAVPHSLLPAGVSRKKEIDAIGTLDAYSFITGRHADRAVDIHRLVHLATRNWLRKEKLLQQWSEKTISRLEEVFPANDHRKRDLWRSYFPHVRYALQANLSSQCMETRISLMCRFGRCLSTDGIYNEAETSLKEGTEAMERVLSDDHPETLSSKSNLASIYHKQGRWSEAEALQAQVLETTKRVLGDKHRRTLTSIGKMASTYRDQGRWTEAEALEVQVLETRKIVLGDEHPHTLTSMGNLASTYRKQGRWTEAEALEVQALETSKIVLGDEHPDTLTGMGNLALIYRRQGRWTEAEALEVQVLETTKIVLGDEHPHTLLSMAGLASTYRDQGRWKEAEALQVQVLERTRVLGDEHPHTLTSMANLASIYRKQGRWTEAEALQVQVLERTRVLGDEHPHTLASMASLASTYQRQGRWKEAEVLQVQVLERTRVLGDEHPNTLNSMASLASTYRKQGRWKEAEALQVQVLETRKRVLGDKHPHTLASMSHLAYTWKKQGRHYKAVNLMRECVQLRHCILGADHSKSKSSSASLARWETKLVDVEP